MYDKDPPSSRQPGTMAPVATIASAMDDEAGEPTLVSLHRLRSAVVELSTALNETLNDKRQSAVERLQRALAMLQGIDDTAPQSAGTTGGLAPWQVRKVLAHIEANLSIQLRNKDLAAVARLSEYHFNVAFRKSVGEAPHEYLMRRRIERAQGLMLSTGSSLSEIALECGLSDQAHLSKLFRSIVGESPAAWRRARANPPA